MKSNLPIGCETLDRDLADYKQYKEYIAPLGIKRLRMQAGWAKTEKVKGQYNWAWLDKIINDAHARGFEPWLEISYGNPIYEGGGGINLSAGIPTFEVALAAWDKWVEALVIRYKDKVKDWEIWNEPNFGDNEYNSPEEVAALNVRTAVTIKKIQPTAKISGLSMGHINIEYADRFFKKILECTCIYVASIARKLIFATWRIDRTFGSGLSRHLGGLVAGENAVVIGGGSIGLLIALVARQKGANVLISEVNANRLSFIQSLGFQIVNPMESNVVKAIEDFTKRSSGKIIFTASLLPFQGGITVPGYASSKGAVGSLVEALANEWAAKGVNVNAIAPGYISTDNTEPLRNDPERSASILARIPATRWGTPEDFKGITLFLASDAAKYVHGTIVTVDGGWMGR